MWELKGKENSGKSRKKVSKIRLQMVWGLKGILWKVNYYKSLKELGHSLDIAIQGSCRRPTSRTSTLNFWGSEESLNSSVTNWIVGLP